MTLTRRAAVALPLLLALTASPALAQPHSQRRALQSYVALTYNMQGKPYTAIDAFAIDHDVIALQEAQKITTAPSGTITCTNAQTGAAVTIGYFNRTTSGRPRVPYRLYYFPQAGGANARNLAFASKTAPADCRIIPSAWMSTPPTQVMSRDVVGLRFGTNTWYWNIHSNASSLATLNVNRALQRVRPSSTAGGQWALLGDTNVDLITNPNPGIGLQGAETRYDTGRATQLSGGNLDWLVASVAVPGYTARLCQSPSGSDHYPVEFSTGPRTTTCKTP
ncbi:endonuclease/exonuclease/phosphatase family protein [Streptosporangium saharense]|uniref:endonuclease/exonuclease/phosphatase family protein n=1 Tax=Streptosporangium saharense TaxID=1706840 RepID=UPI0033332C72